jgi:hypothetical protein
VVRLDGEQAGIPVTVDLSGRSVWDGLQAAVDAAGFAARFPISAVVGDDLVVRNVSIRVVPFTPMAVPLRLVLGVPSATMDVLVTDWSSDAVRDQMIGALRRKGSDAALELLAGQGSVGRYRGLPVRYARSEPWGDGGEQLTIIAERNSGPEEALKSKESLRSRFTALFVRLEKDGRGECEYMMNARLLLDGGRLGAASSEGGPGRAPVRIVDR